MKANNALVWADTMRVVSEWFKEIDAYPDVRSEGGQLIDILKDITQVF
jgi:hypothetical protein